MRSLCEAVEVEGAALAMEDRATKLQEDIGALLDLSSDCMYLQGKIVPRFWLEPIKIVYFLVAG